jgi:chromosome segregation ATPase
VTAVGGLVAVFARLRRHERTLSDVSHAVNGDEHGRTLSERIDTGFARNDSNHTALRAHITAVQDTVRNTTARLDELRDEQERIARRMALFTERMAQGLLRIEELERRAGGRRADDEGLPDV